MANETISKWLGGRIETRERSGIGYTTHVNVYIDGQFVGYHFTDHILDTFYGGYVWRPSETSTIQIAPRWHHLGHGACFLSDVIKAAEEYVLNNPNPPSAP